MPPCAMTWLPPRSRKFSMSSIACGRSPSPKTNSPMRARTWVAFSRSAWPRRKAWRRSSPTYISTIFPRTTWRPIASAFARSRLRTCWPLRAPISIRQMRRLSSWETAGKLQIRPSSSGRSPNTMPSPNEPSATMESRAARKGPHDEASPARRLASAALLHFADRASYDRKENSAKRTTRFEYGYGRAVCAGTRHRCRDGQGHRAVSPLCHGLQARREASNKAGRLARSCDLLLLEFRAERALPLVHVSLVALGINERISPALLQLGVFAFESVVTSVRTEEHVAGQRPEHAEHAFVIAGNRRILCIVHQLIARVHVGTANDDHVVPLAAFLGGQGPSRAPLGVSRREVCGEHRPTQLHAIAVV